MGSVKDLEIIKVPYDTSTGIGRFHFSDRYSVFDWGEMPDLIPDKGKALCIISAFFFEEIEKRGISTHYRGILEDDDLKRLHILNEPSNIMEIELVRVMHPDRKEGKYDYSKFKSLLSNFLIPLEVIYRYALPEGSSVFKRLKEGTLKPSDIGFQEIPEKGTRLEKALIDFSTKLEETDRYLSKDEALQLSGLKEEEFSEILNISIMVAEIIRNRLAEAGIDNEDGKFEFAFSGERKIMLVDSVGTPDECRFTYNDIPLSKEVARIYYRNTPWHQEVEVAKKKDSLKWKSLVKSRPEPLPEEFLLFIANIYRSVANAVLGKEIFKGSPSIKELYEEALEKEYF